MHDSRALGEDRLLPESRELEASVCGAAKNSGIRMLGEAATIRAKSPEDVGDW